MSDRNNEFAIDCLTKYIDSKPTGDKHVAIIGEAIRTIAAHKQISEQSATMIVALAFRDAAALATLSNVSIDDVVEEIPNTINNLIS